MSQTPDDDQLQTYLDEEPAWSPLPGSAIERKELQAHIGEYVTTWTAVDRNLGSAAATWANPMASGRLHPFVHNLSTSLKIDMFQALLPPDWRDGAALVRHLREANTYRNHLAHGTLGMSGFADDRHFGWHVNKGFLPGQKMVEFDVNRLADERLKVNVLNSAVYSTMGPPFIVVEGSPLVDSSPRAMLNNHSLAGAAISVPGTWPSRAARARAVELAQEMFPG